MSDVNKETTIICLTVLVIVVLLAVMTLLLVHDHHLTQREAIKAGLVETPNVGDTGYHWEKPQSTR